MLKSMTGFGRCEIADKDRKVICGDEVRESQISVISPSRCRRSLAFLNQRSVALLKKYIQRGKVDVFITYEDYTENRSCLKYNKELACGVYECSSSDVRRFWH